MIIIYFAAAAAKLCEAWRQTEMTLSGRAASFVLQSLRKRGKMSYRLMGGYHGGGLWPRLFGGEPMPDSGTGCRAVLMTQCTLYGADNICNSPRDTLALSGLTRLLEEAGVSIVYAGCPYLCRSGVGLPCSSLYCKRGPAWWDSRGGYDALPPGSAELRLERLLEPMLAMLKLYHSEGYEFLAILSTNLHSSCLGGMGACGSGLLTGAGTLVDALSAALEGEGIHIPVVGSVSIEDAVRRLRCVLERSESPAL